MRIEQLKSLIEVAKTGSINSATEKLHITQQSLNKSLKSLENELGVKLLDRTKRGVTLTPAGEIVLSASQDIVQRINTLQEELSTADSCSSKISGNLNINISPMISISILPFAFMDFMNHYTQINVYTTERYRDDIIRQLTKDPNDLGILCVSNLIPNFINEIPEEIELILLKQYPIYIAVSARHPLAHHKFLSIRTIQPYPIIVFEAGGISGVHAFQPFGHSKVALSTNNARLCEEKLKGNNAIMYSFPPYIERNIFSSFVHIPVNDKNCYFNIYFAYNKKISTKHFQLAKSFIDVFQAYL